MSIASKISKTVTSTVETAKWPLKQAYEFFAVTVAQEEAQTNSRLPGRQTGPANAYQHLLWSAKLTRRFGEGDARFTLWEHEFTDNALRYLGLGYLGLVNVQSVEETRMDYHNNEIGIELGKKARTWYDVVRLAGEAMARSHVSGDGRNGGVVWLLGGADSDHEDEAPRARGWGPDLPRKEWNWPPEDETLKSLKWTFDPLPYPYEGPEYLFDPSTLNSRAEPDPLKRPLHAWTESDVRRVMASAAYHNPDRERMHALVRVWHEATHGTEPAKRDAAGRLVRLPRSAADDRGGWPIHVDAHARRDGRVAVREHRRHRPGA